MTCGRCGGLLLPESAQAPDGWIRLAFCPICGDRIDRTILRNRQSRGEVSMNNEKEKEPVGSQGKPLDPILKAHRVLTVRAGTAKMGGTSRVGMGTPKKKEEKAE